MLAGDRLERGAYHDRVDDEGLPLALALLPHGSVRTFDSQAAYLRRLKLLLSGEAEALPADAFQAECIEVEDGVEGVGVGA
jgi:hypothetical protein